MTKLLPFLFAFALLACGRVTVSVAPSEPEPTVASTIDNVGIPYTLAGNAASVAFSNTVTDTLVFDVFATFDGASKAVATFKVYGNSVNIGGWSTAGNADGEGFRFVLDTNLVADTVDRYELRIAGE